MSVDERLQNEVVLKNTPSFGLRVSVGKRRNKIVQPCKFGKYLRKTGKRCESWDKLKGKIFVQIDRG